MKYFCNRKVAYYKFSFVHCLFCTPFLVSQAGWTLREDNEVVASGPPVFRDAVVTLLRVSHLVFVLFCKKACESL